MRYFAIFALMNINTEEYWDFIRSHIDADPDKLRLAFHSAGPGAMNAVEQIDCRRRCRKKLAQTLSEYPRFIFPSTLAAEQSTSDALALFHASLITPRTRILDATGGLGIDALHLRDRASALTICEIDSGKCRALQHNLLHDATGRIQPHIHQGDCADFMRGLPDDSFDYLFIDPARRGNDGRRLFSLHDCSPDAAVLMSEMLRIAPTVIVKASPMLDVSQTARELPSAIRLICVGDTDECKELLTVCSRRSSGASSVPTLEAVVLDSNGAEIWHLTGPLSPQTGGGPQFVIPSPGEILLVPYPSIVKWGRWDILCGEFNLRKIAPDTHLFVAGASSSPLPGRAFMIEGVWFLGKKSLKEVGKAFPRADVTVKGGFPMSASELGKRLGCSPSDGEFRVFGCSGPSGERLLIASSRIRPL